MSKSRERSEWNRASAIIVRAHNVHASKKAEMINFTDVHPHFVALKTVQEIAKQKQGPTEGEMETLKRFVEGFNAGRTD